MKARRKWFSKKKHKKTPTKQPIIYALSSLSAQNRGEKLMGKLNGKKKQQKLEE